MKATLKSVAKFVVSYFFRELGSLSESSKVTLC